MKKLLTVSVLVAASIAPAHAISHAYRAQLEREHKTQVQDATGHASAPAAYKPGNLKPIHIKKNGIDFNAAPDGFAYLNGVPMAKDEDNEYATAYSSGLFTVIVYKKNNRINAIEDGKDITRLR